MKKRNKFFYLRVLLNYFENKCCYCGNPQNLHIHHILPVYKGGTDTIGNLECVCKKCHYELHKQYVKIYPYQLWKKQNVDRVMEINRLHED